MIQHLLGATLMAGVVLYVAGGPGRRGVIRRLPRGARLRAATLVIAALLALGHILAVVALMPAAAADAVNALTLLALAVAAAVVFRALPGARRSPERAPRILAIGAHPDDLELACGASLAKLADAGYEIHALVMSPGQVGGDSSRRPSEARAGAALMGVAEIEILDFPDTALAAHSQEMVAAIEARLREVDPGLVLTHSVHDLHQDHHAVHLATLRAGRRHPSILCFESPSTTRDFNPSAFIDVTDYLDIKVEAIRCHRDQRGKPYMGAGIVRGAAAFRGEKSRTAFAEGFEIERLVAGASGVFAPTASAQQTTFAPEDFALPRPIVPEPDEPIGVPTPRGTAVLVGAHSAGGTHPVTTTGAEGKEQA